MSNSYFQFKQFRVEQGSCAMKVSTDACIQGAWTPVEPNVKSVLDIGAGTGLLSLMLAQRREVITIDAIELDAGAAKQAEENFSASLWRDRLHVIHADVRMHSFSEKYDLVICNPPFFNNSLLGDDAGRNAARHTLSMSFEDLFKVLDNVLAVDGYASILLPAVEHEQWKALLQQNGWVIFKLLFVQPREGAKPNRVVSLCCRSSVREKSEEVLSIRNARNQYTPEFITLMKDFYLAL